MVPAGRFFRRLRVRSGGWFRPVLYLTILSIGTLVGLEVPLLMRILKSDAPFKVKLEAFCHLTPNITYPLMIVVTAIMLPVALRSDVSAGFACPRRSVGGTSHTLPLIESSGA